MSTRWFGSFVLAIVVCSGGCRDAAGSALHQPNRGLVPRSERSKVELQPESSPERSRRLFFNELDVLVRAEIEYRDKSVGGIQFHENGKVKESWQTYPNSKQQLRLRTTYDLSGAILTEVEYHQEGNVYKEKHCQKDGSYRLRQFRRNSGLLSAELLVRADGSAESVSYSDDGTRIESRMMLLKTGEIEIRDLDEKGRTTCHSHWQKNGDQDVTYFRENGTVSHRQWWRILRNFDTSLSVRKHRGWVLEKVEEYGANGKTLVRRLLLSDGPKDVNSVLETQIHNADGSYSVRHLTNNRVDQEALHSPDGRLVSTKVYDSNDDKPVEKIDGKLLECWHVISHKFDNTR